MSIHHKKIRIEQLEVGMYVEDVYNARDVLVLSANSLIWDVAQIEKLKQQGVRNVFINTENGKDITSTDVSDHAVKNETVAIREQEYYKELGHAKIVHQEAMETVKDILVSIRKGTAISVDKVEKTTEKIVESIIRNPDTLVSLSEIKGYDEYTYTHSVGVSILVASLAFSMGYTGEKLLQAGVGGFLHDIGKMRVPESILNKPGKYTDLEFRVMKKHPEHGLEIIKDKKRVADLSKTVIIQHHERINGHGYPYGLMGNQIHEVGLIGAVADVYDAMTSNRVYRAAWTPQKTLAMIFGGADAEYSRHIVELFTRHLGIYPAGSFVRLESGAMGVVTRVDRGNLLAPRIVLLFDELGRRLEKPEEMELVVKQQGSDGHKYVIQVSLNPKIYRVDVGVYLTEPILN